MGLFSDISGIFGAVQEKRAAVEAQRILNEAKQQAMNESAKLSNQFDPFVTDAQNNLNTTSGLLQKYLGETENIQVDSGLTAADKIAYQDASRLLNEQMVATGNLRSGAAAFGQSELLRRVVADAETRTFNQQMQKMGLLFGGSQELGNVGATQGQIGLQGKQMATSLLQTAFNLAPAQATAELQKGAALSNILGGIGGLGDSAVNTAVGAFAGGMGGLAGMGVAEGWGGAGAGAMLGSGSGGSLSQMMMLQRMFQGSGDKK